MKLKIDYLRNQDKVHIFEYIYGLSFKEANRQLMNFSEEVQKLAFSIRELEKTFSKL